MCPIMEKLLSDAALEAGTASVKSTWYYIVMFSLLTPPSNK
jgi:hypothetical protein